MTLRFEHVAGWSGVDHFGDEVVSLCEAIAKERPRPEGLRLDNDHVVHDYRLMFAHGRSIVADALSRFAPSADYSGPSLSTIRIKVSVVSGAYGSLVPPVVGEDELPGLASFVREAKKGRSAGKQVAR